MKLPHFVWTHRLKDVTVDGFTVRHDKIYPSFST